MQAATLHSDRLDSQDHTYSPRRRPVLVQVGANAERYTFQFWPDATVNGQFASADEADSKRPAVPSSRERRGTLHALPSA